LECAPDLRQAYDLREELSAIFDAEHTKESGTQAITAWSEQVKQSGLKCFDSFLTTLDNWLDEITNYFLDRQTSGFQEGFNNKVKVLKRRCYGITNVSHLFQRIWLDLEGFKFFGL
jgi:transposase